MKESDIQRLWGRHLQLNPPTSPEAHELKLSKGPSIRIDAVKEHQIAGLRGAKTGLYYKIQDMSAQNGFANPKPFDNFWLVHAEGYVVICFYKLRQHKFVYKIPVEVWVEKTSKVAKKSVREDEIKTWGVELIQL